VVCVQLNAKYRLANSWGNMTTRFFQRLKKPWTILGSLWRYRGYIQSSVKREFQARYQDSILGGLWTILNPLAMILIYTLVFSKIMQTRLPGIDSPYAYSIFLMAGLLPWGFFSEIVTRGQSMFIQNASLLKKVNVPKICIPAIVVGGSAVNFLIVFGLFLIFLIWSGNFPGWPFFALIPVILLQIFLAIGLAMILGVLNVFFRDVGQFFGIFIQFWFWLTPIVYSIDIIPAQYHPLFLLNPMTPIVLSYQRIFLEHQMPAWQSLIPVLILVLVLNLLALRLFKKRAAEMVDEL
jgi:lipopolysaccharide transport system permease protein